MLYKITRLKKKLCKKIQKKNEMINPKGEEI